MRTKLRLHHVMLSASRKWPEQNVLAVFEMQQLPKVEKVDLKKEKLCLK